MDPRFGFGGQVERRRTGMETEIDIPFPLREVSGDGAPLPRIFVLIFGYPIAYFGAFWGHSLCYVA